MSTLTPRQTFVCSCRQRLHQSEALVVRITGSYYVGIGYGGLPGGVHAIQVQLGDGPDLIYKSHVYQMGLQLAQLADDVTYLARYFACLCVKESHSSVRRSSLH